MSTLMNFVGLRVFHPLQGNQQHVGVDAILRNEAPLTLTNVRCGHRLRLNPWPPSSEPDAVHDSQVSSS